MKQSAISAKFPMPAREREVRRLYQQLLMFDEDDLARGPLVIRIQELMPELRAGAPYTILNSVPEGEHPQTDREIYLTLHRAAVHYSDALTQQLADSKFLTVTPELQHGRSKHEESTYDDAQFRAFDDKLCSALVISVELSSNEEARAIADRYNEAKIKVVRNYYQRLCRGELNGFANAADMAGFIRHQIKHEMDRNYNVLDPRKTDTEVDADISQAVLRKGMSLYKELKKHTLTSSRIAQFLVDEIHYLMDSEQLDYRYLDPHGCHTDDQMENALFREVQKRENRERASNSYHAR